MNKSNKKLIVTLISYSVILVSVIICFVLFMQYRNNSNTVEVYYAVRDIEAGTTTDSTFTGMIGTMEVQKSLVKDMEKNGASVVTSTRSLKNSSISYIPKGTILTESMFDDVKSQSTVEKYQALGLKNPYYAVYKVDESIIPAGGFQEGEIVSIEGTIELSNTAYDDDIRKDAQAYRIMHFVGMNNLPQYQSHLVSQV